MQMATKVDSELQAPILATQITSTNLYVTNQIGFSCTLFPLCVLSIFLATDTKHLAHVTMVSHKPADHLRNRTPCKFRPCFHRRIRFPSIFTLVSIRIVLVKDLRLAGYHTALSVLEEPSVVIFLYPSIITSIIEVVSAPHIAGTQNSNLLWNCDNVKPTDASL